MTLYFGTGWFDMDEVWQLHAEYHAFTVTYYHDIESYVRVNQGH